MNWLDLIAFLVWTATTVFLLIRLYKLRKQNVNLASKLLQTTLDKQTVLDRLEKVLQELENKKLEDTDGFLKFVSESRDWAFNYIEETQEAIKKFSEVMDKEIGYFETYGQTMESHHTPNLEKISEAYKNLVKILPNEQGENKQ